MILRSFAVLGRDFNDGRSVTGETVDLERAGSWYLMWPQGYSDLRVES